MEIMLKDFILKKRILQFLTKNDKKTIFFINIKKNLARVALLIDDVLKGRENILLVFSNMEIPACFKEMKVEKVISEDYFAEQDYHDIDEYVFKDITKNWYTHPEVRAKFEYNGIQLGNLVEHEFRLFLIPQIKNLEVARRAVTQNSPCKIISLEDTGELNEVVKLIGRTFHIPTLTLSCKLASESLIKLVEKLRLKISDSLSAIIDFYMRRKVKRDKESDKVILIDARLYKLLVTPDKPNFFLRTVIEKGWRIRFRMFKEREIYFSFYFSLKSRILKQFKDAWKGLHSDFTLKNKFNYKDVFYWDIVKNKLAYFVTIRFPAIVENIELLKELNKIKRIKLIVLRTDIRELEKTLAVTAKKLNIPTLLIQHGILAEHNGHESIYCDKVAVWGQASVEWYKNLGNDINKCVVTGNPRFDVLYNCGTHRVNADNIRKKLKLSSKPIILLATYPSRILSSYSTGDGMYVLLREIVMTIKQLEDKHLIVKVHPYDDDSSVYLGLINELKVKNVTLVKKANIHDLIDISQLLIILGSTTGLEAMILDKPVITVNLTKRKDMVPYAEYGAALGVHKPSDISIAIKDALDNPKIKESLEQKRKEFIYNYAYKIDGQSSQRVKDLIGELVN